MEHNYTGKMQERLKVEKLRTGISMNGMKGGRDE